MNIRYTKEILEPLVIKSQSVSDVLRFLNLRIDGGTHAHVKRRIKSFGIDTSHFKSNARKGKVAFNRLSALEYIKSSCVNTHKLRLKLIEDGIKDSICELCMRNTWNELPIPLELHHKDGNKENWSIENLQILCPNCHAQSPSYCRRKSIKT